MNEAESAVDFDELFETQARFVWRALTRLGVPASDVADASQEVFLVIHRRLPDFEGRSSIKTWVYGICLRVAQSFRNKSVRSRERALDDTSAAQEVLDAPQESNIDWRRARAHLMAVLEQLGDERRQVFVLYELEELSMPEIAEVLECPVTTAYSRLDAARKAVRAAFARRSLSERSA